MISRDLKVRASSTLHPVARRRALRTIAVFEAVKGAAALAASLGFVGLLRHDLRGFAAEMIGYFGLDPAGHYPSILLHYAETLADANLRSLLLLAAGYVLLRFCEAYGLWYQRTWGQWLGALSGGLYIPFEVRHLIHLPSLVGALVLLGNLLVVGYLALVVWQERGGHPQGKPHP
ncbi:MAG TPA: DUF2127 domain-containing protein [Burkholderiaceae bacterium]